MDELSTLKLGLLEALERFDRAVAGFEPVVLETDPAVGSWSARDVAGHLADWNQEILDAAEHILGGPRPRHQPITHGQSYNTMRVAVRGIDPWQAAAADLQASIERTAALLDRLQPEQLRAVGPYPWGEIGTVEHLIAGLIKHVDEHAAGIEEWRLRRLGPPPSERETGDTKAGRRKAWRTRSRGNETSRGRKSGRFGSGSRS
ncbi:MAG TPA: DinB family protein [Thermomicrobiaceae bacterium]|nr:DinB family protein [Thermomicrobiaceae bacterium]